MKNTVRLLSALLAFGTASLFAQAATETVTSSSPTTRHDVKVGKKAHKKHKKQKKRTK